MAQKMTGNQWREFVCAGTRTGKLSTVSADGSPHVAPAWFLLDGDDVIFATSADTVKGHLARNGRAAVCVDDERPPFGSSCCGGAPSSAMIAPRSALRMARRYVGAARARRSGDRNAVPGEVSVRMRVGRVVALSGLVDETPGG